MVRHLIAVARPRSRAHLHQRPVGGRGDDLGHARDLSRSVRRRRDHRRSAVRRCRGRARRRSSGCAGRVSRRAARSPARSSTPPTTRGRGRRCRCGTAPPTALVVPANAGVIVDQWRDRIGLAATEGEVDRVDGHQRTTWRDASGRAMIERFDIAGMGHGIPLATRGAASCGTAGRAYARSRHLLDQPHRRLVGPDRQDRQHAGARRGQDAVRRGLKPRPSPAPAPPPAPRHGRRRGHRGRPARRGLMR